MNTIVQKHSETERIMWIDNLKAFAIFLVLLGHAVNMQTPIFKYIYSFHMPLFFFISGYLFDTSKYQNVRTFIVSKLKTIIVPYILFSILSYLYWITISRNLGGDSNNSISIYKPLLGIFYSAGDNGWLQHNVPLWFLTCLFVTELLFYICYSTLKSPKNMTISIIIFSIIGYISSFFPFRLPWSSDIALTGFVFLGTGYLYRRFKSNLFNNFNSVIFLLFNIILISFNIIFAFMNTQVNMIFNSYGNIIYFYISSFAGIFFYFNIFEKLYFNSQLLLYIGKNTLIILCSHRMVYGVLKAVFSRILKISAYDLSNIFIYSFLFSLISLILILPICHIINKYFAFMIGKKLNYKTIY